MTMVLQDYLRRGGTFAELLTKYAVRAKRHPKHENLVLFKYDQIASPFQEPIVQECRGVILDESDSWRVVSRAFDKFFNHGEVHAASIDWSTAKVQEKVDGSLIVLYVYKGEWHVATSSTPDASGDVNDFGFTFAELFWKVLREGQRTSFVPDSRYCYAFELTSRYNRVVVRHDEPGLTVLGARDLESQLEVSPEVAHRLLFGRELNSNVQVVSEHPLKNFDEIARVFALTSNPLELEGFVVVDAALRRVKVKDPAYVAIHHARDGMSRRALLEIARSGETPEVISAFPELKPELEKIKGDFESLVSTVSYDYERLKPIENQKEFAIAASETRCSAALFAVRKGKSPSVREFLVTIRVEPLMVLLGYKDTHEKGEPT